MSIKKLSGIALLVLFSVAFISCNEEETVAEVPAPAPAPPPPPPEPALKPIQPAVANVVQPSQNAAALVQSSGFHVLQVGIEPSEGAAKRAINKLAEKSIKAYSVEVENPGELDGVFYRIRVGYFKTINDARQYGEEVLKPQGYSFWIDNRSNDDIGNPGDGSGSYSSQSYSEPVASTPAPVAPQADDWGTAPSTPAPAPAPTPTPAAPAADDGWGTPATPAVAAPAVPAKAADDGWGTPPTPPAAPAAPAAPAKAADDGWGTVPATPAAPAKPADDGWGSAAPADDAWN